MFTLNTLSCRPSLRLVYLLLCLRCTPYCFFLLPSFFFFPLSLLSHLHFCQLLLHWNENDRLETLTHRIEWSISLRARAYLFGNLTSNKNSQPFEVSARQISVRDIGPPRCKCCDGKFISIRHKQSEARWGRPAKKNCRIYIVYLCSFIRFKFYLIHISYF